ncbi:MAG: hypothetical protein JRD03_12635 [Deltaproteobacteria bacterium]|nr:hypothetical protein [Deltaproteobacteria bacterium]
MRITTIPILSLVALMGLGCAQLSEFRSDFAAALDSPPHELEARGPGSVFDSIDAAAVDALTYCYLQAREDGNEELMRAGTIERSGAGYTYTDIHVAHPLAERRIEYLFAPQDVARFHVYPQHANHDVNRASERLSNKDRRSVSIIDPLHRSLYVLHPSMEIRSYSGADREVVEVASLRGPSRGRAWPSSFAQR